MHNKNLPLLDFFTRCESQPMMPQSLLSVVFSTFSLLADSAFACQCVNPLSAKSAYQQADLVVLGQLEKMEQIDVRSQTSANTFSISSAWKAAPSRSLVVITGETCAAKFTSGKIYLLYLKRLNANQFSSSRCSGNRERGDANAALAWLKKYGVSKPIESVLEKPVPQTH